MALPFAPTYPFSVNGCRLLVSGPENGDGGANADGCFRAARQNFQTLAVRNIKDVVRLHGDILRFLLFDLRDVHRESHLFAR